MSKRTSSHAASFIPKPVSPFTAWAEEQTSSASHKSEKHLPSSKSATRKHERNDNDVGKRHGAESSQSKISVESVASMRLDDILKVLCRFLISLYS